MHIIVNTSINIFISLFIKKTCVDKRGNGIILFKKFRDYSVMNIEMWVHIKYVNV